jgi:hypothetical protein
VVTPAQANSLYSSLREKIVEHAFLAAVLRELWNQGIYTFEVSRAESDAFGYDVVIECGQIVRHIQLKSKSERRPPKISISKTLADKPSGCVIVIILDTHLEIESFYWFGGLPGDPLPQLEGLSPTKRIRRDKDGKRPPRKNHVDAPISKFHPVKTVPQLLQKLFGAYE